MTRKEREHALTSLLSNPVGRNQLLQMLRQQMQLPSDGLLPVGTPIVQTILNHEFSEKNQAS